MITRRGILAGIAGLPLAARPQRRHMADLGARRSDGVSDAAFQINPYLLGTGWDVIFTPDLLNIPLTETEIFHIALDGPIGSSGTWYRNGKAIGFFDGWANEWDSRFPLGQTDTIAFCWNVARTAGPYNKTTNIQPTVTLWLREAQPVIR